MSEVLKTENEKEVIDIQQRSRDGKGIDGLDLSKVVFIRGETPEDIEEKCLKLCKDYLSGNWTQQTTETIIVKRITGGIINQIYFCGIRQPNYKEIVPQEVAIKLDGVTDFKRRLGRGGLEEFAITLLFSERKLGPKIYGAFEGGQIQQFYKHRPFYGETQKEPKLIQKVYRTLARIHSLDFPIKRSAKKWMDIMEKTYEEGFGRFSELVKVYKCDTFMKYDLKTEINWIKGVIERLKSPVVFCHSDYRSCNLMITEPNDELVVCDFDLSGYNCRGSDFVFMMMENKKKHFIESYMSIADLPLGDEWKPFIEIYVDECQQIYGNSFTENPINSVEHILKEAKIFVMFWYLFHISFHIEELSNAELKEENYNETEKKNEPQMSHKTAMERGEKMFYHYIKIKNILEENKVLIDFL